LAEQDLLTTHGNITADFVTSEELVEYIDEEKVYELEGNYHFVPPAPVTEDDHIEQLMEVPYTTSKPPIQSPYPKSTIE
jgi:hypothetical protein